MALVIANQEHPTQIQTWIAPQYQRKKCISIGPKMMCELGYRSSYISAK